MSHSLGTSVTTDASAQVPRLPGQPPRPSREANGARDRLFFELILAPQIADTEEQDREVRESELDWVIVQPVHLTDADEREMPLSSTDGETGNMSVSRGSVGRFLAEAARSSTYRRASIALSGHRA